MKYLIEKKKEFKQALKRCRKRGKNIDLLDNVIYELACGNKLDEKYNDHNLHGKYREYRECHIEPDWLLIYKIEKGKLILTLTNTGTHSDIFS